MTEAELPKPTEGGLLGWVREAAEMLEREDDYVVKVADAGVFRQLWGICMQTIRHARAYVLLVDAGFEREAMISARAALEHAIVAQWAFHWRDGLQRLGVEMIRQDKEYRTMMGEWLDNDEVRESVNAIPDPPAGAKGMPKFIDILRQVDEGKFLETAYGNLSLAAHVRPSSQASYFHVEGDQLLVRHNPEHHFRYPSTQAAAMAAMFAAAIVMELANDTEALERIGIASDELALPVTPRPGIKLENRRPGPGRDTPWADLSGDPVD